MGGQIAFPGLSLYHASKWAIEGFYEAFAAEVEPFNIQTTLVEPGMARTAFGSSSADLAAATETYASNPAHAMRGGSVPLEAIPGDTARMAKAMIDAAEAEQAPKRLLLGSDVYRLVRAALTDRLAFVQAQKELTCSTDADDSIAT